MDRGPGLRERKKLQTREAIVGASWRLFLERGFDAVSVVDIAREADVSEATVYNHFPTKEDLVYHRLEAFEADLLRAVRDRPAGESIGTAFGRVVLEPRGLLASPEPGAADELSAVTRMITSSRALVARERESTERHTRALAAIIASERGLQADDVEPWVVANALIGVHRALIAEVRRLLLAGVPADAIARTVRASGERALMLVEHGIDERRGPAPPGP